MSIQFPNLGINLGYVGKSIQIFGFEITFFGLVIALGMLLGMGFVILEAKRCGENKDDYLEMMIISLLLGVVGSRMLYVLCSWNLYKGNIIEIFNVRNGGLTFYGGLFGGMLGTAIYGVRRKSFMQMADTASMGIVIAQIIGRWGDFFNRESFGEYTNSIFAMQLPLSAVRSSEVTSAMRENLETIGGTSYIQVHPVFLYESLWCLLLFLLMLVWKRKKHFHGEVFLKYLAGYGLGRFGICQVISAALFLICAVVVTVESSMAKKRAARRRRRREQDYEAQERAAREAEAEEYRDRLRLERAFADGDAAGVPEVYNGTASAYEHDSEESEETSSVEEEHPEEDPQDEKNTEKIVEEENSVAEDFYEKDSEKDTEEISEEEALPEASGTENYVEENAGISEEETVAAKGPTASEEDEWLYSQPRRFAKKPAHEQKD